MNDLDIVRALIGQVTMAARGGPEDHVTTLISRPMWQAFCRGVDLPEDSQPTEWLGAEATRRVYGSRTIVLERPDMWSMSSQNLTPIP